MSISIFLAQAFCIYLVIVSVAMLLRKKQMRKVIGEFSKNSALILVSSIYTLILGILLILFHNVWEADWRVIITFLAWLTFLKGMAYLFNPECILKLSDHYKKDNFYNTVSALTLIIGLYLGYYGFLIY